MKEYIYIKIIYNIYITEIYKMKNNSILGEKKNDLKLIKFFKA